MIIQILFGILSFLLSPWGLLSFFVGTTAFLLFPLISLATSWKWPARVYLKFAAFPVKRAAFVISESNDAFFKQMSLNSLGQHEVTIDDKTVSCEDPDQALHYWLGMRFTFVDEEHGIMFDPRHAAIGMRKRLKDKANEAVYLASEAEWQEFGVAKWLPGVFAFPKDYELVDLSAVQELIDGGERSEFPERVEELYQHSRVFGDGTPAIKFLYPIIALAVTFGGTWFMTSQFGLPSAGPSSTVGFGSALLVFGGTKAAKAKKVLAPLLALVAVGGLVAGIFVFTNLIITIAVVVTFGMGLLLLPLLTFLSQPSKLLSGVLSNLYFKLGLFGYRQPVLTWTPAKYVIKEYDELDTTDDVSWYDQWGHTIGVTYEPGPSSWGPESITHAEIESQQPVTDGGNSMDSRLPSKYVRSDHIKRDSYGAYLPKRTRDDSYYLESGIAMERMNNSASGEKSHRKLLEAKDEYGDAGDGLDDSVVFKTTLVSGAIGLLAGIGVFILPAFL